MIERRYPIGVQSFSVIREGNFIYVDKTEYIYQITQKYRYVFLSRPRRFGKSLLSSTLKCYFEGRKELFEGLAIDKLETQWEKHPVLYFDFSTMKSDDISSIKENLDSQLSSYENLYGYANAYKSFGLRLQTLIKKSMEATGKKATVIIDEYDAPLLEVIHKSDTLLEFRQFFREFYSPLKGCDDYLRFVFLTGVTKFSQLSIFSEFNNLMDISMVKEYSGICGITKHELDSQLVTDVEAMAIANGVTYNEMREQLRLQYDGYHFCEDSDDIFNPFSLLKALDVKKLSNFWFASGTSSYLLNLIKHFPMKVETLDNAKAPEEAFDTPAGNKFEVLPVLYQGGYITIKDYNKLTGIYTLGFPNNEVRIGFLKAVLPFYAGNDVMPQNVVSELYLALLDNNMELMLQRIKTFFDGIPNTLNNKEERHYQTIFYIIMKLMGMYIDVEVNSAIGRADAVLKTKTHIYVIEMKFDGSAQEAFNQIDEKKYIAPYAFDGRKIVKVGMNFNDAERTLGDWIIEEV